MGMGTGSVGLEWYKQICFVTIQHDVISYESLNAPAIARLEQVAMLQFDN